MYEVKHNFLLKDGKLVTYLQSPNYGKLIKPRLIVIHYTGDNSTSGALSWLTSPKSRVSAHLVIDKKGVVYQLLPFDVAAWHAGVSEYEGQKGVNNFSIGIENVGIGDVWPAAQVDANREVISALCDAYSITDIVGHEDVAPGRKVDPGPRYPWGEVTDDYSPALYSVPPPSPPPVAEPLPEYYTPAPGQAPAPAKSGIIDLIRRWLRI